MICFKEDLSSEDSRFSKVLLRFNSTVIRDCIEEIQSVMKSTSYVRVYVGKLSLDAEKLAAEELLESLKKILSEYVQFIFLISFMEAIAHQEHHFDHLAYWALSTYLLANIKQFITFLP